MYAVIFEYSFDSEIVVYTFESKENAKAFLRDNYLTEVKSDIENGWSTEHSISDDGMSAEIINCFSDYKNITTMKIGIIHN